MPDKVEDDEIRKYANLFKLKVEKNNVEQLNKELLIADAADMKRKRDDLLSKVYK